MTAGAQPAPAGERLDAEAFEALAVAQGPSLLRLARRLVGDATAAEDVVQEAFLRAWRGRGAFRGDAPAAGWLARIVHNVAVERVRRSREELSIDDVEERWRDDAYTVDADAVLEGAATRAELEDALIHVPFVYRAAVLMHDVEGYTVKDIAAAQGIALDAAKARLRRGRMALVTALARGAARRAATGGVPLRCADARGRVSEYIDGGLAPVERAALERHLETCPTCPPLYAALVGTKAALGGLRDPDSVIPTSLGPLIQAFLADA